MIQIDSIEIYYFRSIYRIHLRKLKDLNILSGKNDCGKSNILKALNLFFNNETDWKMPLDFSRDFSLKRREQVRKETVKGRQFIRVKIIFCRGTRAEKSLPEKFFVTKTWYRNSSMPEIKTSIEGQFKKGQIKTKSLDRAQAGVQGYVNRIRFEYIPAIKDKGFYIYSLGLLQDIILQKGLKGADVKSMVDKLNTAVEKQTEYLKEEFKKVADINTSIKLPKDLAELFRAFTVATSLGENNDMPLSMRGDGIQARFLPSLLHHITEKAKFIYIWGFEEPENCLEHSLASMLAEDLKSKYSLKAQIFLTTHSPALISLEGNNVESWRVFRKDSVTDTTPDISTLPEDLGLVQLYKKHEREIQDLKEEKDKLGQLYEELKQADIPILLTEAKSDSLNLESAWSKISKEEIKNFRVIKCDPHADDGILSGGGAGMLRKALESCREDLPLTIGLFDRDQEGIKEFNNLDSNFEDKGQYKIHKNKHSAAFLIPSMPDKTHFIEAENLPLEYLFSEEDLIKKSTEGIGLEFEYPPKVTKIGNKEIARESIRGPQYRKIKDGKAYFAEKIVPHFPKESFKNFDVVFNKFKEILKKLNEIKD